MGKTVKKVHQQGRIHKHASIDVTPETSAQIHARVYKGIKVVRPGCGARSTRCSLARWEPLSLRPRASVRR